MFFIIYDIEYIYSIEYLIKMHSALKLYITDSKLSYYIKTYKYTIHSITTIHFTYIRI